MTYRLTFASPRDYAFSTPEKQGSGLASRKLGGQTASERFFYVRHTAHPFMGGSCGESKDSPVLARYANLHESAHPIGVGRAENLNRLARSHTMPKASPRALALVSPIPLDQLSPVITELNEVSDLAEFLCTSVMRAQDTQKGEASLSLGESSALIRLMQTLTDRIVNAATNLEDIRFDLKKEAVSHE